MSVMGNDVGANVVLTANTQQYQQQMQQASQSTSSLGNAVDSLGSKIHNTLQTAGKISLGISAGDVATMTAAVATAARYQDQMRGLQSQSNVLNQTYGQGAQRMAAYSQAVDSLRSGFGATTSSAAQLVQTISGFERNGSTQGLTQLAKNFQQMSQATGENASQLAQSVLSLGQTMGTSMASVKAYSDQITTMAAASNTTAVSLANFASSIGPIGRTLNMTQSQITGFAAAFSKAGQDGYRATNVFSQMVSDLAQSMQTNSPRLQQYANLLGVTVGNLKQLNGSQQLAGIMDSIYRQGPGSIQTLNALGYNGIQTQRTINAVVQQNGGSISSVVNQANAAYGNGSASQGATTLTDQFSKLGQSMEMVGEALGKNFLPAVTEVVKVFSTLASWAAKIAESPLGKVVSAFMAVVAPVAAVAGAFLVLSKTLGAIASTVALFRSSLGQGLIEGARGGGLIGSGQEIGTGALMVRNAEAGLTTMRPMTRGFYNAGAMITGTPRAFLAARNEAAPGISMWSRFQQGARFGTSYVARNFVDPMQDAALYRDPNARTPFFQFMGKNAAGLNGTGEQSLDESATKASASLTEFSAAATKSDADFLAAHEAAAAYVKSEGDLQAATDVLVEKFGETSPVVEAATQKLDLLDKAVSTTAAQMAAAGEEIATAAQAASASILKTVTNSALLGVKGTAAANGIAARAGLSAAGSAGATGLRALAGVGADAGLAETALGLATGPVGMIGLLAGTLLLPSLLGNKNSAPSSAAAGTGAAFTIPGTISAPVGTTAAYNANSPTAAQAYAATQNSDYTNPGAANITTPQQAAAMYGPVWNKLSASDKQALSQDLLKAFGGSQGMYRQFISLVNSGQYSTYGAQTTGAVSGVTGGTGNALNLAAQQNQGIYTTQGANVADLQTVQQMVSGLGTTSEDFYTSLTPGKKVSNALAVRSGFGGSLKGAGGFFGGLVKNFASNGFLGGIPTDIKEGVQGASTITGLSDQGKAIANQLGLTTSDAQAALLAAWKKAGAGTNNIMDVLQNLPDQYLATVLQQFGGAPVGNQAQDFQAIQQLSDQAPTKALSVFRGLGLSRAQQQAINTDDSSSPQYGAQLLGQRATPQRLYHLETTGITPNTVQAALAYQQSQMSVLSPMMNPLTTLFGSSGSIPSRWAGGITQDPSSLFSQMRGAQRVVNAAIRNGQTPSDTQVQAAQSATQAFTSSLLSAVAQIKSYNEQMQQIKFSQQQFAQSMQWAAQQQALQVQRQKQQESISVGRSEQQENISVSRSEQSQRISTRRATRSYDLQTTRAEQDFELQRSRAEADYNLQRSRSQADFDLQRQRSEDDYNLQRSRAQQDYDHQVQQTIKQAAQTMMNIYQQNPVQNITSAQYLLYNNQQQTSQLNRQNSQLTQLQKMGLSTDAIQQLGLTDASNNQELNSLFQQMTQNPQLIDQMNTAVSQRLAAAGTLATNSASETVQEQQYEFNLQMQRSAQDFNTSMDRSNTDYQTQMQRSATDFSTQMNRSATDFTTQMDRGERDFNTQMRQSQADFTRTMNQQAADFSRSMKQQAADFNREMSQENQDYLTQTQHSWTSFTQSVNEQMTQLNDSITPLSNVMSTLKTAAQSGNNAFSALAKGLENDLTSYPNLLGLITGTQTLPQGMKVTITSKGGGGGDTSNIPNAMGGTGGHANGGVLPGYSLGVDNLHYTNQFGGTLNLSGGEGVMVPEFVKMVGGAAGVDALNKAARGGSYASGGVIRNLSTVAVPAVHVASSVVNNATDASTNFNGEITVVANDPAQLAAGLKQQARLTALSGKGH